MARLFIANCTNQHRRLNYRLDFTTDAEGRPLTHQRMIPYRYQNIPPGRQEAIGGDLHPQQVGEIISQLSRFGMVPVMDVKTAKAKGRVPLVYNLEQPVPRVIMQDVQLHNRKVMTDEGAERRRRAAIVSNEMLSNTVHSQGIPDISDPRKFEMEFEQVGDGEEYAGKPLEEGLRVVKGGRTPTTPPKRSRRKAA